MYMTYRFFFFFLCFIFLFNAEIRAQQQTSDSVHVDADKTLEFIQKADSSSVMDSIQRVLLQKEMEKLKTTETKKRRELEQQLQKLTEQDSLRKIALSNEIEVLKKRAKGFPVVPYKDTLFFLYTRIGTVTAEERARLLTSRLKDTYAQFATHTDSLFVSDLGGSVALFFKDNNLITITELDAMWANKTQLEIANYYKDLIQKDITYFKSNTTLFTWLRQIGLALLVIVVQVLLVKGVNRLFRNKIDKWIESLKGTWFDGIKFKNYEVLDPEKQTQATLFISKILRWLINVVQLYITIPLLFSIFPPTQRLAETLFGYILSPLKSIGLSFLNYIPNLFTIIVIVVITRYVLKFIKYIASEVQDEKLEIPGFYPDWAKPTFNIVRFLVLAFMFVMIFPYLPGSDSPVFQGVSVFLGLVFSLGSSSVISNMVAGLVMTYMRPFQIGDRIKIGDIVGDVVERTAFVTRIKTPKKEYITIPNSNILSSNVLNYSTSKRNEGIVLHTTVTIGYDVPWRDVHTILINAAMKTQHIMHEPKPFVLQTSLDDFYVSYQLNAYSDSPNKQPAIYSELHQNIQDEFNESGVEILSPHYRAQRDGNQVTIPAAYLPDNYEAPHFRIKNNE